MKLLTIDVGGEGHPGVMSDAGEVIDLTLIRPRMARASLVPATIRGVLEAGQAGLDLVRRCKDAVDELGASDAEALRRAGALRALDETPLLAPVAAPRLILSAAANYGKHVKEFTAVSFPKYPTAFIKTLDSLSAHNKPIVIPDQFPDRVDFEGEMCFVFGRECHNVSEADAMDYVAGYTIANDVSARNWVPEVFGAEERFETIRAWERNVMGKNLPGFTPCGPFLTTADEVDNPHALALTTTLNGEVMQSSTTEELLYNLPQLISYFSKWYRFHPGDIFTTGSPAGVGVGRKPQVFMKAGDVIEVQIAGLGKLSNTLSKVGAVS